ncbi:hypothetical protein ABIB86_000401 [Bradyrhizobium sp. JR1.7]|uniref:hypothetical protein n=1 Tax=unclassified Bradyrhizobium TaxID=2631580 RepID=UPI003399C67A
MTTKAQHLQVIRRYADVRGSAGSTNDALRMLFVRRGIERTLTPDAIHELAMILIRNRMLHNRFAAESRKHHRRAQLIA